MPTACCFWALYVVLKNNLVNDRFLQSFIGFSLCSCHSLFHCFITKKHHIIPMRRLCEIVYASGDCVMWWHACMTWAVFIYLFFSELWQSAYPVQRKYSIYEEITPFTAGIGTSSIIIIISSEGFLDADNLLWKMVCWEIPTLLQSLLFFSAMTSKCLFIIFHSRYRCIIINQNMFDISLFLFSNFSNSDTLQRDTDIG